MHRPMREGGHHLTRSTRITRIVARGSPDQPRGARLGYGPREGSGWLRTLPRAPWTPALTRTGPSEEASLSWHHAHAFKEISKECHATSLCSEGRGSVGVSILIV